MCIYGLMHNPMPVAMMQFRRLSQHAFHPWHIWIFHTFQPSTYVTMVASETPEQNEQSLEFKSYVP